MDAIHSWLPNESSDLVISHLRDGECVVLPTESTYEIVASALNADAVVRAGKYAASPHRPAIIVGAVAHLADWMPLLRGAGARMFRKFGPLPLTLVADGGFAHGSFPRLPEVSRQALVRDGHIAIRWPSHPIWAELRRANMPLVSVPLAGCTDAATAARVTSGDVRCVIDAGPTQYGLPPSVIIAEGRRCRLVHEGAVSAETLEQLALCRILFVCTGNTCRSPMAGALCAKLLADRLGCTAGELARHGYGVQSAGLSARMGEQASLDAVRVAGEHGADLSQHLSRPASLELLQWADHVFVMTAMHAYALTPLKDMIAPRLLSPQGDDIADPIGGELADYRACAEQIIQCLQQRLPEILES